MNMAGGMAPGMPSSLSDRGASGGILRTGGSAARFGPLRNTVASSLARGVNPVGHGRYEAGRLNMMKLCEDERWGNARPCRSEPAEGRETDGGRPMGESIVMSCPTQCRDARLRSRSRPSHPPMTSVVNYFVTIWHACARMVMQSEPLRPPPEAPNRRSEVRRWPQECSLFWPLRDGARGAASQTRAGKWVRTGIDAMSKAERTRRWRSSSLETGSEERPARHLPGSGP